METATGKKLDKDIEAIRVSVKELAFIGQHATQLVKELHSELFYQLEAKHGAKAASLNPCIVDARKFLDAMNYSQDVSEVIKKLK